MGSLGYLRDFFIHRVCYMDSKHQMFEKRRQKLFFVSSFNHYGLCHIDDGYHLYVNYVLSAFGIGVELVRAFSSLEIENEIIKLPFRYGKNQDA